MNRGMKNIILILVLFGLIIAAYFSFKVLMPKEEAVKYEQIDQKPSLAFVSDELIISKEISDTDYQDFKSNGLLVNLETYEEYFAYNFDYDLSHNTVVLSTYENVYRFHLEENLITKNNQAVSMANPIRILQNEAVFNIKGYEEELGMSIVFNDESKQITVLDLSNTIKQGHVIEDAYVRADLPIGELETTIQVVDELKYENGQSVDFYLGSVTDVYREILTKDGRSGYVLATKVVETRDIEKTHEMVQIKALGGSNEKIFLGWDNEPGRGAIEGLESVNILSPTWYSLQSGSGEIRSIRNEQYRNWIYEQGIELWPLFSNSFDLERTHEMLASSENRQTVIDTLLEIFTQNKYHGINIDFENVYLEDKELLVQFLSELVPVFHQNNILVSIDITVEGGSDTWSRFLDRKEIGKLVDYVAVMTYDEHWKSSPISGPVASLDWVDSNMGKLVQKIDHDKLILGVPFYVRVWHETPSTSKVNAMKVRARDLYMTSIPNIINENALEPIWDDENSQWYVSYIKDGILYKIWIEDEKSLNLKTKLVDKYDLAGVAGWSVRFTNNEILNMIENEMK